MGLGNGTQYIGPLLVHHLPITSVYVQIAIFHSVSLACYEESNLVEKGYTKLSQSPHSTLFCFVCFFPAQSSANFPSGKWRRELKVQILLSFLVFLVTSFHLLVIRDLTLLQREVQVCVVAYILICWNSKKILRLNFLKTYIWWG